MICKKHFFVALMILLCHGCWYYSFKGALPSELKTVAVPLFDDNSGSAQPGLRENLTNQVVDAFIEDNTLKITNESDADLLITGVITSIPPPRAASVSSNELVEEYHLYINVKVKCEDIKNSKVLWEKTISQYGVMSSQALDEERDAAINEALEKITEEVINNTLGYW